VLRLHSQTTKKPAHSIEGTSGFQFEFLCRIGGVPAFASGPWWISLLQSACLVRMSMTLLSRVENFPRTTIDDHVDRPPPVGGSVLIDDDRYNSDVDPDIAHEGSGYFGAICSLEIAVQWGGMVEEWPVR
jgi:hypothetical protein